MGRDTTRSGGPFPLRTLGQDYPGGDLFVQAPGTGKSFGFFPLGGVYALSDQFLKSPQVNTWNLFIQRQFGEGRLRDLTWAITRLINGRRNFRAGVSSFRGKKLRGEKRESKTSNRNLEKGERHGQQDGSEDEHENTADVSLQEWEAARQKLLVKEKELTRDRDALAAERRRMPWMLVEKKYEFEGPRGKVSLLDLFEGRPSAGPLPRLLRAWRLRLA